MRRWKNGRRVHGAHACDRKRAKACGAREPYQASSSSPELGERNATGPAHVALAVAKALDRLRAMILSPVCSACFGLAQNHHRRAALAGGDAEAGREPDGLARHVEGRGKDVHAQPLGEHRGVGWAAAGQNGQKLVLAGAAQQVVAAQQARDAADQPGRAARRRPPRPAASSSGRSRRCRTAAGTAEYSCRCTRSVSRKSMESRVSRL